MKPLLLINKELIKYQISTVFKCFFLESPIENNKTSEEEEAMDVFRTYGIYLTYLKIYLTYLKICADI